MPASQVSFSELVENVADLNVQDYEKFLLTVNTRRAQRRSDVLSKEESDLLKKIYQTYPQAKKERLEFLNAKIWDETLTEPEHIELLQLIEQQEEWAAERMNNLVKLATLRNTDYATLVKQLGIPSKAENA